MPGSCGDSRRPRRTAGQSGFTLIEMMIAVAVLAVIGAIAIPSIDRFYGRVSASADREGVERELASWASGRRGKGGIWC